MRAAKWGIPHNGAWNVTEIKRGAAGHFAKGQSGNPGGRKKQDIAVIRACQDMGLEAVIILGEIMRDSDMDPKNRITAIKEILDRAYGKATATVSLGDDAGEAIRQIIFRPWDYNLDGVEDAANG